MSSAVNHRKRSHSSYARQHSALSAINSNAKYRATSPMSLRQTLEALFAQSHKNRESKLAREKATAAEQA